MTDIICPLCGKPNTPDLNECKYCQAPLKTGGFISPFEGESEMSQVPPSPEETGGPEEQVSEKGAASSLEQAVPDWLRETEASFLEPSEPGPAKASPDKLSQQIDSLINPPAISPEPQENAIDDEWLASLLKEAGAVEAPLPVTSEEAKEAQEPGPLSEETREGIEEEFEEWPALLTPTEEKPDWLSNLEASSKIKLEGGIYAAEPELKQPAPIETPEEKIPEPAEQPEWLTRPVPEKPVESPKETEPSIAPAELPGWLEALRPSDTVSTTGPVEDVSGAEIVTAGPLMGLRGVISAHPSAIRAQKPPTYSIKLKVTQEQQERLVMMEELLADEEKPRPLPSQPVITSRYIFRLIVAIILLLPIIWMIVTSSHETSTPQPGNIPGVVDFAQRIQSLPTNTPVLIAFDYEAGFSGEMYIAITNMVDQLVKNNIYMTLVSTTSSGPALAESIIKSASANLPRNYANLGYLPGGTMGLLGLAASPANVLPYALDGSNVWAGDPLNKISLVKDFAAVIVITNDPDTARIWIEQVGPQLQDAGTPLLFITSAQAEPLIRPYYEASPAQVQGLIAGLAGGVVFARTLGNIQQNGVWDAYSAGITISVLIILVGSIAGVVLKMLAAQKKKET